MLLVQQILVSMSSSYTRIIGLDARQGLDIGGRHIQDKYKFNSTISQSNSSSQITVLCILALVVFIYSHIREPIGHPIINQQLEADAKLFTRDSFHL